MALEIERKYLVTDTSYRALAQHVSYIKQGYLSRDIEATVRVRIRDDRGFLTVKGRNSGAVRHEFEYEVPAADAIEMLTMCSGNIIEKRRYLVPFAGHIWEIDEFILPRPMTVAEVELTSPDEAITLPPFIGQEVTGRPEYYNSSL